MDKTRQDLALAFRQTWRQPSFTFVVVVVLGAAIGLNASLFTAFNAVVLRPWPVPDPERVVKVYPSGWRPPITTWRMGSDYSKRQILDSVFHVFRIENTRRELEVTDCLNSRPLLCHSHAKARRSVS